MNTNIKLVGQAKRQAREEAIHQAKMAARYGKNSYEYGAIAVKRGWK